MLDQEKESSLGSYYVEVTIPDKSCKGFLSGKIVDKCDKKSVNGDEDNKGKKVANDDENDSELDCFRIFRFCI